MWNKLEKWNDYYSEKYQKPIMYTVGIMRLLIKTLLLLLFFSFWLGMSYLLVMALYRVAFGGC